MHVRAQYRGMESSRPNSRGRQYAPGHAPNVRHAQAEVMQAGRMRIGLRPRLAGLTQICVARLK